MKTATVERRKASVRSHKRNVRAAPHPRGSLAPNRRDEENKMRLSALRPPLDSGWSSNDANPGRRNAPREREDVGCLKSE
jgi:hypothetical protein